MIGLVFYYEDFSSTLKEGKYTFMHNINMEMWRQTAKVLGCTHFIAISPNPDYVHNDAEIIFKSFSTREEMEMAYPDISIVYLEDERVIPGSPIYIGSTDDAPVLFEYLENFIHPSGDTFYVVGPDYLGMDVKTLNLNNSKNKLVTIKTATRQALWSIVAASIAIYDRMMKTNA